MMSVLLPDTMIEMGKVNLEDEQVVACGWQGGEIVQSRYERRSIR